jgi:RNA polymerase sigma factor (sigma-70 family)
VSVVRRFRRGGATLAQIEAAYRLRFREYSSVAAGILGDREAGRDAVQEAFAKAVRGRHRFRGEGSLEGWLWRSVVNTALSEGRRRAAESNRPAPDPPTATGRWDDPEADDVQAAIAALPERQRLVLFLRYYADLDYAAIGEALGIAPGTVAAALHAAHAAVRRQLQEVHA